MDPLGFEPRASSLQRRHSTTELWARPHDGEGVFVNPGSSKVPDHRSGRGRRGTLSSVCREATDGCGPSRRDGPVR